MKYWEIIADNLSKAGWSWGCVSAIDSSGRTIWIADAHRDDGKLRCARGWKAHRVCGTGISDALYGSLKAPACSCVSITELWKEAQRFSATTVVTVCCY
jgi:hypothetical protein